MHDSKCIHLTDSTHVALALFTTESVPERLSTCFPNTVQVDQGGRETVGINRAYLVGAKSKRKYPY